MAARFETGGPRSLRAPYGLTCTCHLCVSKPNTYGESGISKVERPIYNWSESGVRSRMLQFCKGLEGTSEGANHCTILKNSSHCLKSIKEYGLAERVEGNYHEGRRQGNKPAPAKGRKAFNIECKLLYTLQPFTDVLAHQGASTIRSKTCRLFRCASHNRKIPSSSLEKAAPSSLYYVGARAPVCGQLYSSFTIQIGASTRVQPSREGWVPPNCNVSKALTLGQWGMQFRGIGTTSEQEVQCEAQRDESNIMTLSQSQLKMDSISSSRYGLTKFAELKRHRDGKYRNLIDIIADPLVLLAAYGHLKIKSRAQERFYTYTRPLGASHLRVTHTGYFSNKLGSILRLCNSGDSRESLDREWFDLAAKHLKEGHYECKPARRIILPKPKSLLEKMPISIVSLRDQIIQEVVRIVLNYIYNRRFSLGLRRNCGYHYCLKQIRNMWSGVSWFIEFDISKCHEQISRRILVNILREDIQDQRFFNLIHKMFSTRIVTILPSDSAQMPQGSLLSPLLCDLYLSKLDEQVKKIQVEYNSSQRTRRENPVFNYLTRITLEEKRQLKFNRHKIRRLLKKRIRWAYKKGISKTDYNDPNFARIFYVRYADNLLFGVIGSKLLAKKVQMRVSQFLKSSLQLEVRKTAIAHSTAGVINFLGINIRCIPPKYSPLRRSLNTPTGRQLKSLLIFKQIAYRANLRHIIPKQWAEAFEKTSKFLGSPRPFLKRFKLAYRLRANGSAVEPTPCIKKPQLDASVISKQFNIEQQLPKEIKQKHLGAGTLVCKHQASSAALREARDDFRSFKTSGNPIKMLQQNDIKLYNDASISKDSKGVSTYFPLIFDSFWRKSGPPILLAPLEDIRAQLRNRGIIEDQNFRPMALKRILNHEDSAIVNYFKAIAYGLLSFYRCCDNFHEVKRIATYQIRWAALYTLANKHKLTVQKAIDFYTLDLVIRRESNGQVIIATKFPSKKEIAIMRKKFLIDADFSRYLSSCLP